MLRRMNLWLVTGAVVLVALAAAACGRDAGAPADPAGPVLGALVEGARVRTAVTDRIVLPADPEPSAPGGAAQAATSWRETEVRGGQAREPEAGTPLAMLAGRGGPFGEAEQMDADGHRHRVVVTGDGKGPLTAVRYERDGEVVAEVLYRWEPRTGGFVLRQRVLTLKKEGRVLARLVRTASVAEVLPGAGALAAGADPAGGSRPPIAMAQVNACFREWVVYIGASTALIVAGEVYTVAPNPASAAALLAAAGAWEQSLDRLLICQYNTAMGLP